MSLSLRKSLWGWDLVGTGHDSDPEGSQGEHQPPHDPPTSSATKIDADVRLNQLELGVTRTEQVHVDSGESDSELKKYTRLTRASQASTSLDGSERSCENTYSPNTCTFPFPAPKDRGCIGQSIAMADRTEETGLSLQVAACGYTTALEVLPARGAAFYTSEP